NELLQYMEEAAEALDLMNGHYQIQHLDVKPQNLFLIFNHVKIADFGLAKDMEGKQAILTGGVTPVYAAPETFEGQVSRWCDQYSLAIVYQEMLTGLRPFPGSSARQLMLQHLQSPPDLSSLDISEQPVVDRALAKAPDKRFPSCTEFVQALRDAGKKEVAPTYVPAEASAPPPLLMRAPAPAEASPGISMVPESSQLCGLNLRNTVTNLPSLTDGRLPPLARVGANSAGPARPAPPELTGPGALLPTMFI